MATIPEEKPVAPVVQTPVATAPNPLLTSLKPEAVYSPTNIQQIDVPSTKKVMDMKLSSLEKKLAKANSIQELNQIGIMNQPKAMGVLTGEAAYRSKLDTARINAFNSLYNTRLAEEQRKEAERQQFIQTYGADPKSRPKGMSKKEFAKAIQGGKFQNLLTTDAKSKLLDLQAKQKSLAGTGETAPGASPELTALASVYTKNNGDWGATVNELASKGYDVSSGSVIDNELRRRNGLDPITPQDKTKSMSAAAATSVSNVISGLDSINKLEGMDTGWGNRLQEKLPFAFGARDLRFEYDNIRDILQRMRTGAAISATEESFYKDQIPGLFDDEATRTRKLSVLKDLFSRIKDAVDPNGNMTGSMTSGEIEVMDMKTGKKGTISADEMDNTKYIRI